MSSRFLYPLSFQTVLPDDYERNKGFGSLLTLLRELGFWGVELNLNDPKGHRFDAVRRYLARFGLEFSMFATGLTARRLGLSLSHTDEASAPARGGKGQGDDRMGRQPGDRRDHRLSSRAAYRPSPRSPAGSSPFH